MIEGHVRQLGMGIKVYDTIPGLMLYSFNMPIFIFVSGLLAYKTNMNIVDFLNKIKLKFIFLVVPAVIFVLFYDLLSHRNPIDVTNTGFGRYWFTISLFECFFLYYLSCVLIKKESIRHVFLLILSFIGIGVLSVYQKFGLPILDMNHLTKYFQFFVFGILSMRYKELYEKIVRNDFLKAIALISFFALLFLLDYSIWPKSAFHLMRDIVLRYLGTFVVVSFFVCHAAWFDNHTKINNIIMNIGQKSLAIYLLQYFFLPDIKNFGWTNSLDLCSIHIISALYTIVITVVCLIIIDFFSNSNIVKKYCLGQK